jgi:hypothetical protein
VAGQVGHGFGGEVMVVRHRPGFAVAGDALEQVAHAVFGDAGGLGHVAHARRVVRLGGEQRQQRLPQVAVGGGEFDAVAGQVQPGVALGDSPAASSSPSSASKAGRASVGSVSRRRRSRSTPVRSGARSCSLASAASKRSPAPASRRREGRVADDAQRQPCAQRAHHRRIKIAVERVRRQVDTGRLLLRGQCQRHRRIGIGQRRQHGQAFRAGLAPRRRRDVEHRAAGDGVAGGGIAQDEAVAGQCADIAVDLDLRPVFAARRDFIGAEQRHPCRHVNGAEVQVHLRPVLQRRLPGEHAQLGVEAAQRLVQRRARRPTCRARPRPFSIPASASAMRCPAWPASAGASCTRRLRTRTGLPVGDSSS